MHACNFDKITCNSATGDAQFNRPHLGRDQVARAEICQQHHHRDLVHLHLRPPTARPRSSHACERERERESGSTMASDTPSSCTTISENEQDDQKLYIYKQYTTGACVFD